VAGVLAVGGIITLIFVLAGKGSNKEGGGSVATAAERTQSINNLRQIGIAMHDYHDTFRHMPPAVVYDKTGKPLYSWRVLLLPFVEGNSVYRQFKLDEPWDNPHNKALLGQMPRVYAHPGSNSTTDTHYLVFDGQGAAFTSDPRFGPLKPFPQVGGLVTDKTFSGGIMGRIPGTFTDGTSNTILIVEADQAVPWSKPADLPFGPNQPLPPLGGLYGNGDFLVALVDSSIRTINRKKLSDSTLRAAITANGGDVLGSDWND
jgi:hypothetical protein